MWRYIVTVFAVLAIGACDSGPGESLYDPDRTGGPDPVISDVQPPSTALAGVDVVTITGQNFSSNPDENFAYFGGQPAELLESSPTEMRVIPPNQPNPDAELKVSVLGAEFFSNAVPYTLEPAAESFGGIAGFEELFGMTSDVDGNLYASMFSTNVSIGIIKFAPDETRSTYVQSTFKWDGLAFGPDGLLYTVRGVRAMFRFSEGSPQETWVVLPGSAIKLIALVFDDDGFVWTGGRDANIYRVAPDKSVAEFPFDGDITGLAFADQTLYATADVNEASGVWRFAVDDNGEIGSGELLTDISGRFGSQALSVVVASTGELLVGTDGANPMILIQPDGSAEEFYPGILQPPALALAWGPSPYLYMNQAPGDGTDADLIRINARRDGAR